MEHGTKHSQYWKEGTMQVSQTFTSLCSSINKTSWLRQLYPVVFCTLLQWQVPSQTKAWLWLHSKEILLTVEGTPEIKLFPGWNKAPYALQSIRPKSYEATEASFLVINLRGDWNNRREKKTDFDYILTPVSRGLHVQNLSPCLCQPLLFLFQHEWGEQTLTKERNYTSAFGKWVPHSGEQHNLNEWMNNIWDTDLLKLNAT